MAIMHFSGVDDIIAAFDVEAGRIDRNGDAAVEAGADVLIEAAREEAPVATGVYHTGRRAGEKREAPANPGGLRDSVTRTHAERDERGNRTVTVYPDGLDPRGERYATIGSVLEYGRSDTPPNPWMERAGAKAENGIDEAMQNELAKD